MSGLKTAARMDAAMAHQFIAYRQSGNSEAREIGRATATTLAGALAELSQGFFAHKDTLFVVEKHDGLRKSTLHAYRIRKGAATYLRNPQTGLAERVEPLKPDHLFSLPVDAFQPTRPFDALLDDATGVDWTLVEGGVA
jgi:hypothetical protein